LRAAQRRPVRRDWFLYDLPGLRLEDVVLPLHNLSAYLHALGDRAVSQLGAQASKITARRIDEFLLAFGGRILEAEQEEVLPLHRYWRHG
jgi:hypothetical protein